MSFTVNLAQATAVAGPFLGYGFEWDFYWRHAADQERPFTEDEWAMLMQRVSFMRPGLVRTMLSVVRFCPGAVVGEYAFDSPGMQTLYRILEHCQQNRITVMAGTWGAGELRSNLPAYAQVGTDLIQHLVKERGFDCVRYAIHPNEPDYGDYTPESWMALARMVRARMNEAGLEEVGLLGPDTSTTHDDWLLRAVDEAQEVLAGYEIHRYPNAPANGLRIDDGSQEESFAQLVKYVREHDADGADKPFILGEAGCKDGYGPGDNQPELRKYGYGLTMGDWAVQCARAGVQGMCAWMLDDCATRKLWGMWDTVNEPRARPWFYAWALVCRFMPAGATVLRTEQKENLRTVAARLATAQGSAWTVVLVNQSEQAESVRVNWSGTGVSANQGLRRFVYAEQERPTDADDLPVAVESGGLGAMEREWVVPGKAMLVLTTMSD